MLFMPGLATGQALLVSTVLAILAVGYTVPPLRLSYRTLGEFTVGLTHSLLVILCGYIYQNGDITNQKPWLISLPLFLSILPSITMSNVPDRFADRRTSKKTIAVRFGANAAALFAIASTLAALTSSFFIYNASTINMPIWTLLLAMLHGIYLTRLLWQFLKAKRKPQIIPRIMIVSLTFLLWYSLVPMLFLFGQLIFEKP